MKIRRIFLIGLLASIFFRPVFSGTLAPLVKLEGSAFSGGSLLPSGARLLKVHEKMEAQFSLASLPKDPLFLYVKARNEDGPGAADLEISLNGVSLFQGGSPFQEDYWSIRRFPVHPGTLKPGINRLVIAISPQKNLSRSAALSVAECQIAAFRYLPPHDLMTNFTIDLPSVELPFPLPLSGGQTEPGFKLRGTKGWAWYPEQYLAEIPYLARYKMNFLMNCYTSMFTDVEKLINRWWEPLPEAKKKAYEEVVRACQAHGITFCFSMHPQLFSERPLQPESEEDFESLWQHYAWMQSLGIRWFNVCYDDIGTEGQDKAKLGRQHARLVNTLLARLRKSDAEAQLIFCPTYYWGCDDQGDARLYLEALGQDLDKDVFVFWTGDGVVTAAMTRKCAETYKRIVNHRLIIWDNYPVNDRNPVLHLGPVTERDPELAQVAYGYMSNPLCPQHEVNRIPLLTCADFAYNPTSYDPMRSIGQAILQLAQTPSQRQVLKELVELYPGMLICGETRTAMNCVGEKFSRLLQEPDSEKLAKAFVERLQDVLIRLEKEFPERYLKTRETVRGHLSALQEKLKK
jgi:hypothetical protein